MGFRQILPFLFMALIIGACGRENPRIPGDRAFLHDPEGSIRRLAAWSEAEHRDSLWFPKLSREEARMDLRVLKYCLEKAHTPLYRYRQPYQIDSFFLAETTALSDSVNYPEMIRILARLQHLVACGHSAWSHHPAYYAFRDAHTRYLPFGIRFNEERVEIAESMTEYKFPDHAVLLAINDVPVEQILDRLRGHMYRDGNSDPDSRLDLEQRFANAYANFFNDSQVYRVTWKAADDSFIRIQEFEGMLRPERQKHLKRQAMPTVMLQASLHPDSGFAILDFRSFNNERIAAGGQEFTVFVDSVFGKILEQGIDSVCIDLRGNTGGWTANGRHLFSWFIDTPTPYMRRVYTWREKAYPFAPLITRMPEYPDTSSWQPYGEYRLWTDYPNLIARPVTGRRYRGKVTILVDGMTRSSAAVFCTLMQEHRLAVFVGEETGTARCGPSGMVMEIRLPFSGARYAFSTAIYETAIRDSLDSRGVRPGGG